MTAPKIIRIGTVSPVPSFDPREAMADAPAQIAELVFDSLFRVTEAGRPPEPILADGPVQLRSSGPDGVVYEVPIRTGVQFADGTELTAEDVVASLGSAPSIGDGAQVLAEGNTVILAMAHEDLGLATRLAAPSFAIVREHDGRQIGTGPYRLADDSRPERARLVRNPRADSHPDADEIHFVAYPTVEGGVARLVEAIVAGEVDLTVSLPREEASALDHVHKRIEPGLSTCILFLNTATSTLADPRVRRAIAMAIDRVEVAAAAHDDAGAHAATCLLPPGMGKGRDDIPHDPDRARSEIERARLVGQRLSLVLPWAPRMYVSDPWGAGEAIAVQLANIGLLADLAPTATPREALDRAQAGEYDLMLAGWSADTPDPADFVEALLHSRAIPGGARPFAVSCNLGRLADPEIDAAIEAMRAAPSPSATRGLNEQLAAKVPIVPLCYGYTVIAHGPRLRNIVLTPSAMPDLRGIQVSG